MYVSIQKPVYVNTCNSMGHPQEGYCSQTTVSRSNGNVDVLFF